VLAWVVAALVLMLAPRVAVADTPPWAQGVSKATQDKANALFAEANQLFAQRAHAPALEKYEQAIALWDHPLIRFNMAVTLIHLDRILEAADQLELALRYGEKPFDAEHYQQALDYQTLIAGRVGYIEASCTQPGAHVSLDGKPWFQCPGTQKQRVLSGEHVVGGDQPGFVASSQHLFATGGAVTTARVALVSLDSAVVLHYPVQRWVPWSVGAAGAAVALAGLAVWLDGKDMLDNFNSNFATTCASGCPSNLAGQPYLESERSGAKLRGEIGVSMIAAGGAAAAAGVTWAIINKPHRELPAIEAAPTRGGATASVGWRF
jgi:hypothetical protein